MSSSALALGAVAFLLAFMPLSSLGDLDLLPRLEVVGGEVIALLQLFDGDTVLASDGIERLTSGDGMRGGGSLLLGAALLLFAVTRGFFFRGRLFVVLRLALDFCASRHGVVRSFEADTQFGRMDFTPCAVELEDSGEGQANGIGGVIPWDDTSAELGVEGRD